MLSSRQIIAYDLSTVWKPFTASQALWYLEPDLKVTSLSYQDLLRPWRYQYGLHGRTVGLEEVAAAIARSDSAYLTTYGPQVINL